MPVSAVRKRLPNECPSSPPPSVKRYWKRRASRSSSSASAAMQLRTSPGGSTPNSRRRRPEEPPSSDTVTTAASSRTPRPTPCVRPRSSTASPVPPPIATSDWPGCPARPAPGSAAEEAAELAALAELREVRVVEGMDAVLGVQVDGQLEEAGRFLLLAAQGMDRGREVGEALVLRLAAATGAELQRLAEVAAVLVVDGEQERIGGGALALLLLLLRPAGGELLPSPLLQLGLVGRLGDAGEQPPRLGPLLPVHGADPLLVDLDQRTRHGLLLRFGRGLGRGAGGLSLALGHRRL